MHYRAAVHFLIKILHRRARTAEWLSDELFPSGGRSDGLPANRSALHVPRERQRRTGRVYR